VTGSRYPTVEAALVSKYAPLVSPNRSREKKEQDAVDFRRMVRANHQRVDRSILSELAGQVWEKGSEEILNFIELTLNDKPLPI
jgi:ribosomal protein L31E